MKILSPYGKNVARELKDVYNLNSLDEMLQRVRRYLANDYGSNNIKIEMVHIAFGTAIKFVHNNENYYLKFTGKANHHHPEELFPFLEHLRQKGLPLPELLKTLDGVYFKNFPRALNIKIMLAVRNVV